MSLRSPVGKVLGLGSAGQGSGHWWTQRVSAVALLFLGLWFVGSLIGLDDFGYASVSGWVSAPLNSVLLILLVGTVVYHSFLGVEVVVEDYVAHHGWKVGVIVALKFIHIVLAALGIFAVLRVAFGSAA